MIRIGLRGFSVVPTTALLIGFVTCSLAIGQTSKSLQSDESAGQTQQEIPSPPAGGAVALEGPVDPDEYILGPGDQLEFNVWGVFERREAVIVAPDGAIAVPSVGELKVAGLSLSQADSLFRRRAAGAYPKAEVHLRLTAIRTMKAAISGAVNAPGLYTVTPVDRLSALVKIAGGLILPDEKSKEAETIRELTVVPRTAAERRSLQRIQEAKLHRAQASLRHIAIISRDGSSRTVDLQRFYVTGDLSFNPLLRDGDAVLVPIVNREIGVIDIFGAVKSPGQYEFRPGDKLRDIIELAGGFRADAINDTVSVVRFEADGQTQTLLQLYLTGLDDRGGLLRADDRVFVRKRPDFMNKVQVTVKGEVFYPGSYAIEADKTRLSDVIKACGGITDRANLYSARVIRRSMETMDDPEFERLKTLTVADMTDMEYEYFKIRSREEAPLVVVDFMKLFVKGDGSQDVFLQDKDEIEIPTISPTVKVAGQVTNPGLLRYVEGSNYEYYIEKAGGFSWNARKGKIRLIKAHSGMWVKPRNNTPIEIGDTIFVPEKQETDWWALSKDMLLAVSQIATVLIMIRSLK